MSRSRLEEVMSPEFVGVKKMLIGKKFPINIHALRIGCLEFLRGHVDDVKNYNELEDILDQIAKSRIAKRWYENLTRPILLMMCRKEQKGKQILHSTCMLLGN